MSLRELWRPWDEIARLRLENERLRMQLAAISVAAEGNFRGCRTEWESAALQDVLALRQQLEQLYDRI
jgi:hypothetical protein